MLANLGESFAATAAATARNNSPGMIGNNRPMTPSARHATMTAQAMSLAVVSSVGVSDSIAAVLSSASQDHCQSRANAESLVIQ
jgi:hypothetical protein